jgi:hypothetical protein
MSERRNDSALMSSTSSPHIAREYASTMTKAQRGLGDPRIMSEPT